MGIPHMSVSGTAGFRLRVSSGISLSHTSALLWILRVCHEGKALGVHISTTNYWSRDKFFLFQDPNQAFKKGSA